VFVTVLLCVRCKLNTLIVLRIIPAEGNELERELYVRKGGVVNWPDGAQLPSVGTYFLSDLTI
jgi:hypothetical protein